MDHNADLCYLSNILCTGGYTFGKRNYKARLSIICLQRWESRTSKQKRTGLLVRRECQDNIDPKSFRKVHPGYPASIPPSANEWNVISHVNNSSVPHSLVSKASCRDAYGTETAPCTLRYQASFITWTRTFLVVRGVVVVVLLILLVLVGFLVHPIMCFFVIGTV